jgi:hypothetical protein
MAYTPYSVLCLDPRYLLRNQSVYELGQAKRVRCELDSGLQNRITKIYLYISLFHA